MAVPINAVDKKRDLERERERERESICIMHK